jgi:hypothetical protein
MRRISTERAHMMLSLIIDEPRRAAQYTPVLFRMQAANFRTKN